MSTKFAHSGTAILLNDGETAYVYDHGYYMSEVYYIYDEPIYHVELNNSNRAIAKSCEFLDDGSIYIFDSGKYIPYAFEDTEDAHESFISSFIKEHELIGECTIEEWDHFSDVYKDVRGIRPRFGSYKFHII